MKHILISLIIMITMLLAACVTEDKNSVPVFKVIERDFPIEVKAFGEIEAAESQNILTPGRRPMTIAWLKDENTYVEKGDIIAKFDAQQLLKDSRKEELDLMSLNQDILQSIAQQNQTARNIDSDQIFVKQEFDFVERFAIDDLRIYSQLEIIDTLANKEFLEAKDDFLNWKEGSIIEQHTNEMAVLDIRRHGMQTKYQQHQQALSSLDVVSPYSGLLIYEKDRRGEKPVLGQTVFPGRTIAQIPNLDDMQARLFVQANDAIDLNKGQALSIRLDAFPSYTFNGEIIDVSGFPRSIERGNPVAFFEVTASLLEQDKSMMQPGRKLKAVIQVKKATKRLVVPLQSLFFEDGNTYVYLQAGKKFVKRKVISGRKNLYFVEITSGLTSDEFIALSKPSQSDQRNSQ